jgi:lipopolysaccharide export system permease protein
VHKYKRDVVDHDQIAGPTRASQRQTNERSLVELLNPREADLPASIRTAYLAEANNRLSQPLYCLAYAMIGLAAVLWGRRQRGAHAMRLSMDCLAAAAVRIAGFGVAGPASGHPALDALFYVIPLLGMTLAWMVLMGFSPRAILERRRRVKEAMA